MKRLLGTTELPELIEQTRVAFPSSSSVVTVCSAVVISFPSFPIQVAHSHADRVSQSATTNKKKKSNKSAAPSTPSRKNLPYLFLFTSCSSSIFSISFGVFGRRREIEANDVGGLRLPTQERGEHKNRSKGARKQSKRR